MGRARRHHYLPQFHQRYFGIGLNRGRIWVYDKQTDELALRPIRHTAVISNYYTVPTAEGPSDELERAFAGIEGDASKVVAALCEAKGRAFNLLDEDRFRLSAYLGLLFTRVPAARNRNRQLAEYMASVMLDMDLARAEGWAGRARSVGMVGTDDELEAERKDMLASFRAGEFRVQAPEEVSLGTVPMGLESIAPIIAGMSWLLLKRSTFPYYLVGDAPVTVWGAKNHPPHLGVGFLTDDAEVSIPLSRDTQLVLRHDMPDGLILTEDVRGFMPPSSWPYHYRQWNRAERFVFGSSRADLEAVGWMLAPDVRQESGGGLIVRGAPEEWQRYAGDGGADSRQQR